MISDRANRFWFAAFIFLCCAGAIYRGWQISDWGDRLSPVDSFSEANALREVDGYRAQGFLHDWGLGNVLFGSRYPNEGFVYEDPTASVSPGGVYTHYPPGPEWLLYAATLVLGPEPVSNLRFLPLILSAAAAVFFGLSLRLRFGAGAAWLVMVAFALAPLLSDANVSIHFLGYALALLVTEVGLAIGRNTLRTPFLLLGFLQGWLSFDYVFLVVGTPLAVELALPLIDPEHKARLRLAIWRSVLAAAGFALAHVLHFLQVWAYWGSLSGALTDIGGAAAYRAGLDMPNTVLSRILVTIRTVAYYIVSPDPVHFRVFDDLQKQAHGDSFRWLGVTLGIWWPLIAVVLAFLDFRQWRRGQASPLLLWRWCLIGLIGFGVSSLWWVVMLNHAIHHKHLLYRHLALCFLIWTTFLSVQVAPALERLRSRASDGPSAKTGVVQVRVTPSGLPSFRSDIG